MAKYCVSCGAANKDGAGVCYRCGKVLAKVKQPNANVFKETLNDRSKISSGVAQTSGFSQQSAQDLGGSSYQQIDLSSRGKDMKVKWFIGVIIGVLSVIILTVAFFRAKNSEIVGTWRGEK